MHQLGQTPLASAKMHRHPFIMVTLMRFLPFLLLSIFSLSSIAAEPVPDNLEPLPPPIFDSGPDSGSPEEAPPVTITRHPEPVVEEYRVGGKLYMIKVTPKIGPSYYLVDDQGDGKFVRQESLDSGLRPPRWVIRKF